MAKKKVKIKKSYIKHTLEIETPGATYKLEILKIMNQMLFGLIKGGIDAEVKKMWKVYVEPDFEKYDLYERIFRRQLEALKEVFD